MISVHIMYPKTDDSTFDMDYYTSTHMPMLADALGIEVLSWVSQVHDIDATVDVGTVTLEQVEADPTRCPDPDAARAMTAAIEQATPTSP